MRYPFAAYLEPLQTAFPKKWGEAIGSIEHVERVAADRKVLAAMTERELRNEHAAERDRYERSQFFNQPPAVPEFNTWAQYETWSVEEAVALLLGRNPEVVNWNALKGYAHQGFEFVHLYQDVLQHAKHAEIFSAGRVKPAEAWHWATRTGVVTPAADLTNALVQRKHLTWPEIQSVWFPPDRAHSYEPPKEKREEWTPEKLSELRAYRAKHGTTKAAEHFGISPARVRKLLPGKAKVASSASVFTHRPK